MFYYKLKWSKQSIFYEIDTWSWLRSLPETYNKLISLNNILIK
ncbi:hypothetical protein LCGC14_0635100 [marine sediment metagenome]|uniref:Uncharacterized protein n=1 Tax=marine sediment metagenome TaxID=412755 RepID=A0A0F9R641_9ZZZZ